MSILRAFYFNNPSDFASILPVNLLGGGDGGAGDRAERDRREQKEKEARIAKNISLIDVLFDNDPSALEDERLILNQELGAFGTTPARNTEIQTEIDTINESLGLLEGGPTKVEREQDVVTNVENFFFDDLEEQRERGGRDVRFEIARRAGFGGSQEIDALEEFQRKEDKARLDIGTVALDARNDLRSQDALLRSNLIDQANRDIQTDILTGQFVNNLGTGLARATDSAKLTQFDPFFENAGNLFSNTSLIRGDELGRQRAFRQLSFFSADPSRNQGIVRG